MSPTASATAGVDDTEESSFARRGCACFCTRCFRSETTSSLWHRFRSPENKDRWYGRGWRKVREWSEIVAGHKWKTFIRRVRRTRAYALHGSFQYDPLSYALNFDDGYAGFSPRFAGVHVRGT